MEDIQNKEDEITVVPNDIISEKKIELEYSSQKYFLIIRLKENAHNNVKKLEMIAEKDNSLIQFFFEKIMKFEDFKNLGKLFVLHENIEEVHDLILEIINDHNISIVNIDKGHSLTLSLKKTFPGIKEPFSTEIKLLKKERDRDDIIDILYSELKEKEKMLEEIKQKMSKENEAMEEKIKVLEKEYETLKEKNKSIEKINDSLKDSNKSLEEIKQSMNMKNKALEEKVQLLEGKIKFLEEENESIKMKNESIEVINNTLMENMNEMSKTMEEKIQILGEKSKSFEEENQMIMKKIKSLEKGKKYYLSKFSIKDNFAIYIQESKENYSIRGIYFKNATGIKSVGKFRGTKTFNAYKLDSITGRNFSYVNGYCGYVFLFYVMGTIIRCSRHLYASFTNDSSSAAPTYDITSNNYDVFYIEIDLSGSLCNYTSNSDSKNCILYYDNNYFNNIENKTFPNYFEYLTGEIIDDVNIN